ncbi:SIS domain-containing protein, partial [Streptomyces spiralis]
MSDRTLAGQFFDAAIGLLQRVRDEEAESVTAAGTLLADTV